MAFIPLKSLTGGVPDPKKALGEIRGIYFKTTRRTIDHDFAHAIELLKSLSEDDRDRAAVYMEGLAQMRQEWSPRESGKRESGKKEKGSNRKAEK